MSEPVTYRQEGEIAILALNGPPVNSLGQAMRAALLAGFKRAMADPEVRLLVLASTQKVFCGGADISEFGTGLAGAVASLGQLIDAIEAAPKPVLAAVNGMALGGGLELALACDYRLAAATAMLGLPEVTIGLIPGAGGTQRLPRLAGVRKALDMITTGKPVSAADALQSGFVDEIAPADQPFDSATLDYARRLLAESASLLSCADLSVDTSELEAGFFEATRTAVAARTRGQYAPERAVMAVEIATRLSLAEGLVEEGRLFEACGATPQARALQHLFFAERASRKIPGVDAATPRRAVNSVGIVGAGTMGGGIAMSMANAGLQVRLVEVSQAALQRGLDTIRGNYEISVQRGKLKPEQAAASIARIEGGVDFAALATPDLVIEAVFEKLATKQDVFRRLDAICKPGAILATNTSYQDVDQIAAVTARPGDVLGLHFFSPANVMRLLEVVRARRTADDVLVTCLDLGRRIGKLPVVSGVCQGFIGNRMLEPYGREVGRLLLEGASPEQIDGALTGFGFAMGFCAVMDLAGIDVGYLARQGNEAAFAHDPSYAAVSNRMYELGRLGQKTGRGFYIYEGRERIVDPEVEIISAELAAAHGIARRAIGEREILERCLYPLINEGARILDEGIALRSGDIDLVYVNGYGFPAWRGGPMQYADEIGPAEVLTGMRRYQRSLGDYGKAWFQPSALLERLAQSGGRFSHPMPGKP